MAASEFSSGSALAAKEHMVSGKPLTRLEAIVLFGVSNLPELVYELRHQLKYIVKSRKVSYAAAMVRVNQHATLIPPPNLPIREIQLTEYWVSK